MKLFLKEISHEYTSRNTISRRAAKISLYSLQTDQLKKSKSKDTPKRTNFNLHCLKKFTAQHAPRTPYTKYCNYVVISIQK